MADVALERLAELLRTDPRAPIGRSTREQVETVHIADSLSGLEFAELREAKRIADLGAGAGLPGLVIAARSPKARVDLIDSQRRKCEFMERAAAAMGVSNATVVTERAEAWARGAARERYDAVTARAVARLSTLAELSSPLLRDGGYLLAWKGGRDPEEESELARALPRVAMEVLEVRKMTPYHESHDRHIHLLRKNGPTPNELPRRDGSAAKRPFGSE